MIARFDRYEEACEVNLAKFIAECIRQGLRFEVRQLSNYYEVEFTGGF